MTNRFRSRSLVLLLAVLFGVGFGLNYGRSNQVDYLLRAVQANEPTLWTRDAFIQTSNYHPAYAYLCALLLRISPSGLAIAWANVVFIALGILAVYGVLTLLLRNDRVLPALWIVLILASVTRTMAPGVSYAFSEVFQPSTLGSVGLLAAAAAFVAGRPFVSGLCLAVAGIFHINDLLLGLCVFGLAWLLTNRSGVLSCLVRGLGPAALVLLWFVPFLVTTARAQNAAAQRIYMDIRLPHHYCVRTFAWDFSFWAGFQLLGLAALVGPVTRAGSVRRRLILLLLSWSALVIPAALLSSVVIVRPIQQLFAWRISAEAELLAQAALAAALVGVFCDGRRNWRDFDRRAKGLAAMGLASLVVGAAVTGKWTITLVVLSLCVSAYVVASGILGGIGIGIGKQGGLSLARVLWALLMTLVSINVLRFSRLKQSSNVLSEINPGVTGLCAWAKTRTSEEALFLTPPDEEDLRFQCQRAIVVDWKSNPAVPNEVLSWFERIEDVTGRRPFRGQADLAGYDDLDAARVVQLQRRYGIDYVVVEKAHPLSLGKRVFSNAHFLVYALSNDERLASVSAR